MDLRTIIKSLVFVCLATVARAQLVPANSIVFYPSSAPNDSCTIDLPTNALGGLLLHLPITVPSANDILIASAVSGNAITAAWAHASSLGLVTSVTNSDGSLTISPTTGAVVASLNTAHQNTWTATQIFAPSTDTVPIQIYANNSSGETNLMTMWSSGGSPTQLDRFGDDGEFETHGGIIFDAGAPITDAAGLQGSAGQVLESQGAGLGPLWSTLPSAVHAVLYDASAASPTQIIKPGSDFVPVTIDNASATFAAHLQDWKKNGSIVASIDTGGEFAGSRIDLHGTGTDDVLILPPAGSSGWQLTLPTGSGTSGYVLSTNGSGVTSWVPQGGLTNPMTTTGDVIYSSDNSGTPARLGIGSQYQSLQTNGSGLPGWDAVHLDQSAAITGLLPIANGGTGQSSASAVFNALSPLTTLGDILYENATPAAARLAGNTTTTKEFLTQTGTGTVSAAPAWAALTSGDIPDLSGSYLTNENGSYTQQTGDFYLSSNAGALTYNSTLALNEIYGNFTTGNASALQLTNTVTNSGTNVGLQINTNGTDIVGTGGNWSIDHVGNGKFSTVYATQGTFEQDGIGRTPTLALLLANTTAATSSLPEYSPYLDLRGQEYYTGGGGNISSDVRIYDSTNVVTSGTGGNIYFEIDGRTGTGAYSNILGYRSGVGGALDDLYIGGSTTNSGVALHFNAGGNASYIYGGISNAYPGAMVFQSGLGSSTRGGGGFAWQTNHSGTASAVKVFGIDLKAVATNATDTAIFTFGNSFVPEIVYTPIAITAVNAGITMPAGTVISINHGTETGSFPITIPAGTAGQQLTIQNNTSYPTGGTVIDPGATQSFVYQNSAWQLLGQNPLFRELKITATINAAAAPTTTTTLYTMPTTGFTYFEPVFVILRVVSVSGGPTAGTLQIGSAPAPTSILGTTTEPVTSVGNCTLSLSSLSGGNVAPITPGTAIISTIATSAAPGTLVVAADIWGIYIP